MVLGAVFLAIVTLSGCVTPGSFSNATVNGVKVYKMDEKKDGAVYTGYLYFVKQKAAVNAPTVMGLMVYDGPNGRQFYYQIDGINTKVIREIIVTIDGKESKLPLSVLGQTKSMEKLGSSTIHSSISTCSFELSPAVVKQQKTATAATLTYGKYTYVITPEDIKNIATLLQ
jgi:hypothetical protein